MWGGWFQPRLRKLHSVRCQSGNPGVQRKERQGGEGPRGCAPRRSGHSSSPQAPSWRPRKRSRRVSAAFFCLPLLTWFPVISFVISWVRFMFLRASGKRFALQRNAVLGALGAWERLLRHCFMLKRRQTVVSRPSVLSLAPPGRHRLYRLVGNSIEMGVIFFSATTKHSSWKMENTKPSLAQGSLIP